MAANPWRSPSDQAYLDQWLREWKARQPKGYVPKPGWEDRVLQERRQTYASQGAAASPAAPPPRPDTSQRVPVNTPGVPYAQPTPQSLSSLLSRPSIPFQPQPQRPYPGDPAPGPSKPLNLGPISQQPRQPAPMPQLPVQQPAPMQPPAPPPPPRMQPGGGFRSLAPGTVPADQWRGGLRQLEPAMEIPQPDLRRLF